MRAILPPVTRHDRMRIVFWCVMAVFAAEILLFIAFD
jgi:hypothetical protein